MGQFTRQQAIDLVLNHVLVADTGRINLHCAYDSIPNASPIVLFNGQTVSPPYQFNWVFFSDDKPNANWNHPCRLIFINSSTGEFEIYTNSSYPINLRTNYEVLISLYSCTIECYPNGAPVPPPGPPRIFKNANDHLFAVLINGVDGGNPTCDINRDYDIAMIYNALEEAGYPTPQNQLDQSKNHITTLYDDGATSYPYAGKSTFGNTWDGYQCPDPPLNCTFWNEVNGRADKFTIDTTFAGLA
jgi:hypothetical protein